MRDAVILLGVLFVLSCWTFVIGHRMGLEFFDRVAEAGLGAVPIGYTITALTVSIIFAAAVGAVFKR